MFVIFSYKNIYLSSWLQHMLCWSWWNAPPPPCSCTSINQLGLDFNLHSYRKSLGLSFACLNSDGTPTAGRLCDRNGDSAPLPVYKSPFFVLSIKSSLWGWWCELGLQGCDRECLWCSASGVAMVGEEQRWRDWGKWVVFNIKSILFDKDLI